MRYVSFVVAMRRLQSSVVGTRTTLALATRRATPIRRVIQRTIAPIQSDMAPIRPATATDRLAATATTAECAPVRRLLLRYRS